MAATDHATAAPSVPDAADHLSEARALLPRVYAREDVSSEIHELAERARSAGDVPGECAARYAGLAAAAIAQDTDEAHATATAIVQRASNGGSSVWESVGRQYLARLHLADAREDLALREVVEAELLVDGMDPSLELGVALNGIAIGYSRLGLFEDGERIYTWLEDVTDRAGDRWSRIALEHNRLLNRSAWSLALLRTGEEEAALERLQVAAEQAWAAAEVEGSPARHEVHTLLLFTELMIGRISVGDARERFATLVEHATAEPAGFVRFGLAYRLAQDGRLAEAREEAGNSLAAVDPVEGEAIHTMLTWLQARVALQEDPGHPGLRDVGRYAELASRQVWELRLRRREAAHERLRTGRLRREHERMERVSLEDPLTGAANRRRIDRERAALLTLDANVWTTVIYADLDRFKDVNDSRGHEAGDRILRELSRLFIATTRDDDLVGRYGGDEFVMVIPDCGPVQAERLAQRLLTAIREHDWTVIDPSIDVRISLGLAVARGPHGRLFPEADEALYEAKRGGRDRAQMRVLANGSTARAVSVA